MRDIFERDAWFRWRYNIRFEDLAEAEKHYDAALTELTNYPAPLVTWKVHAERARLKSQLGDSAGAQEFSARALEIVNYIAANVSDENLRAKFLVATRSVL